MYLEEVEIGEIRKKDYDIYASIDERYLATMNSSKVFFYQLPEKKIYKILKIKHPNKIFFLKDDYVAITNTAGSIFVYNLNTEEEIFQLRSSNKYKLSECAPFFDVDYNLIFTILSEKGEDHLIKIKLDTFSTERVPNMKYGHLTLNQVDIENKIVFFNTVTSSNSNERILILYNFITLEKREHKMSIDDGTPYYLNHQFFIADENQLYSTIFENDTVLRKDQALFSANDVIVDLKYLEQLNLYAILTNDIIYLVDQDFLTKNTIYIENDFGGTNILYLKTMNQLIIKTLDDLKILHISKKVHDSEEVQEIHFKTSNKQKSTVNENSKGLVDDGWLEEMRERFGISEVEIDSAKIDYFKNIQLEHEKIKKEYADKLSNLRTLAEETIVKLEYSKGGELLHRGFYCPSVVIECVVGGLKRGRLYKRKIPVLGDYSYEYGFDADGKLIRVKRFVDLTTKDNHFEEEYLIYLNDVVYGVEFDRFGKLTGISRCFYNNGILTKYEGNIIGKLYYEEYTYDNNEYAEVTVFFDIMPNLNKYNQEKLLIEQDEEGNISKIISLEKDGKTVRYVHNVKR